MLPESMRTSVEPGLSNFHFHSSVCPNASCIYLFVFLFLSLSLCLPPFLSLSLYASLRLYACMCSKGWLLRAKDTKAESSAYLKSQCPSSPSGSLFTFTIDRFQFVTAGLSVEL